MGSQPDSDRTTDPPRMLLARPFDEGAITELRHEVITRAAEAGLDGQALDDFTVAVNELVTNAVRHGGGHGVLRLWHRDATVVCEVSDSGDGITRDGTHGFQRPPLQAGGGWGLWLARRLSGDMAIDTGPSGTTVRISASTCPPPAT